AKHWLKGNTPVKYCAAIRLILTSCCGIFFSIAMAQADNWPQWRGPDNDGTCKETNLPTEWSVTKNILWKLALPGMSGATPAIWGNRIFLTSEDGSDVVLL